MKKKDLLKENRELSEKLCKLREENAKLLGKLNGMETIFYNEVIGSHIKSVISNPKKRTTVVIFGDDKKVIVKCAKDVKFELYSAVAYALAEKVYKNNSQFKRVVNNATKK